MAARKKGEVAILQCARCGWSNEVPLGDTADSTVIACVHCGASIYWHRCGTCGLCYLGEAQPRCPLCDGVDGLDGADGLDDDLELA